MLKKPDGTEVQIVAQRSLNAVVRDVKIQFLDAAAAGEFITADIIIYDY